MGGWVNFSIPSASVDAMTRLNCFRFGGFFAGDFCGFSAPTFGAFFCRLFFHIFWLFSLILNGFNIRQERIRANWNLGLVYKSVLYVLTQLNWVLDYWKSFTVMWEVFSTSSLDLTQIFFLFFLSLHSMFRIEILGSVRLTSLVVTLLKKCWRISLYVTYDAIAMLYVT